MIDRIQEENSKTPSEYLADISEQVTRLIVGQPENKTKFIKHIDKVIREAEKYKKYLHSQWQKAQKSGLATYDKNKTEPEWIWWTGYDYSCVLGSDIYLLGKEAFAMNFHIKKGQLNIDPLGYLGSMILGCVGEEYEGLELLDYQFILLAIIYDAQNWNAGRERIYFDSLKRDTLANNLCYTAGEKLSSYTNSYSFRDIRLTIEVAMLAVKAELQESDSKIFEKIFGFKSAYLEKSGLSIEEYKEYLDIKAMVELPDKIFTIAQQTIGKKLSRSEKEKCRVFINKECHKVSNIVKQNLISLTSNIQQDAIISFMNEFNALREKIIKIAESIIISGKIDKIEICKIQYEYLNLMNNDVILETVDLQELKHKVNKTHGISVLKGKSGEEKTKKPNDLIDLCKAIELYHRSRAQIKRDIKDNRINDYRIIKKGKHWISKKEADNLYITK